MERGHDFTITKRMQSRSMTLVVDLFFLLTFIMPSVVVLDFCQILQYPAYLTHPDTHTK
jgi:hypothetical protein